LAPKNVTFTGGAVPGPIFRLDKSMVSLANLSFSARAMHRFLDGEDEEEALRFWKAFLREEEEEEEEEKEALKVRAEGVVVCIVLILSRSNR
jgi:hypothetical protein